MKINVIGTGSSGNLYEILDSDGNALIIEAGLPRSDYMKYKLSKKSPEMCVISHGHSDHKSNMGEYQAMIKTHLKPSKVSSDNYKVKGYEVKHGEIKTTAFLIKSVVDDKFIFFGTDFEFSNEYDELFNDLIEYNVSNFLIECNYNDFLMHLATPEQRIECSRHLSDNDVVNFMRIVKPKNPKIILIHGSNRLANDTYTKKYIGGKLITATIAVAVGAKKGVKNVFTI